MTIAEKILALRKARAWSQEELAAQIGVTRQAVSRWESGAAMPDADKVIALCDCFGVTADYLLRDGTATEGISAEHGLMQKKNGLSGEQVIGLVLTILGVVLRLAVELVGIFKPHTHFTDTGTYHGWQAYVRLYHLQWIQWLLYGLILLGIVLILLEKLGGALRKIQTRGRR